MHIILKPIENLLLTKNNKNQIIQIFFKIKTVFHQQVHLPVPCVNFTQITIKNLNLKNKRGKIHHTNKFICILTP